MSMHRSLKTQSGALNEHRNVLTRAERIVRLTEQDRFVADEDSPLNLPKVANRAVRTAKKKKATEEQTEEGAETTEAASGDAAAASASSASTK